MYKKIQGTLMLMIVALIWGTSFVAQSSGMEFVGPFTFLSIRFAIAEIFLVIWILISKSTKNVKSANISKNKADIKKSSKAGILCGVVLFIAATLQQFGVKYTTVGKAGFISALYVVIVPVAAFIIWRRSNLNIWISVGLTIVGLYFLCISNNSGLISGDIYVLLSAIASAVHIMVLEKFSRNVDNLKLSCIQFLVIFLLSSICMILLEKPHIASILSAWFPIVYAGTICTAVGFTLQIIGQKQVNSTQASIVLSLESVFAALGGLVLLKQMLSLREIIGCLLMFSAQILAQLPNKKSAKLAEEISL